MLCYLPEFASNGYFNNTGSPQFMTNCLATLQSDKRSPHKLLITQFQSYSCCSTPTVIHPYNRPQRHCSGSLPPTCSSSCSTLGLLSPMGPCGAWVCSLSTISHSLFCKGNSHLLSWDRPLQPGLSAYNTILQILFAKFPFGGLFVAIYLPYYGS